MRNTILLGDALAMLKTLPSEHAQCIVTSPPYYALRDYNVDGQIGMEETPEAFVDKLVEVFHEARRVLRSDGTLWLNIGDTYANDEKWGGHPSGKHRKELHEFNRPRRYTALPGKNLIGIPWKLAFALQADGYYLRSDIIWHKPTAMPESVTDRPTKAHEYLFLLTKEPHYYYDADAIREPLRPKTFTTFGIHPTASKGNDAMGKVKSDNWNRTTQVRTPRLPADGSIAGANKRSVWTVASQPYEEAHFATFPPKLIEPCILAGTSPQACECCGAPWRRIAEATGQVNSREVAHVPNNSQTKTDSTGWKPTRRPTDQWEPTCTCPSFGHVQCIVLDPFMGAGTTALVALQHHRDYLGIELNPAYVELAKQRIATIQPVLWEVSA